MQARGRQSEHWIAGRDPGAGDDRIEIDGPEARADEVQAAHDLPDLRELAARDLDPGQLGTAAQSAAERAHHRIGFGNGDVVEHRERLCPDADQVVGVHRDAVDPDSVPATELLRHHELRPDTVGRARFQTVSSSQMTLA